MPPPPPEGSWRRLLPHQPSDSSTRLSPGIEHDMTVCGTEAFKEVIRVDSKPIGLVSLREEEIRAQPHIGEGHVRALGADSRL